MLKIVKKVLLIAAAVCLLTPAYADTKLLSQNTNVSQIGQLSSKKSCCDTEMLVWNRTDESLDMYAPNPLPVVSGGQIAKLYNPDSSISLEIYDHVTGARVFRGTVIDGDLVTVHYLNDGIGSKHKTITFNIEHHAH